MWMPPIWHGALPLHACRPHKTWSGGSSIAICSLSSYIQTHAQRIRAAKTCEMIAAHHTRRSRWRSSSLYIMYTPDAYTRCKHERIHTHSHSIKTFFFSRHDKSVTEMVENCVARSDSNVNSTTHMWDVPVEHAPKSKSRRQVRERQMGYRIDKCWEGTVITIQ